MNIESIKNKLDLYLKEFAADDENLVVWEAIVTTLKTKEEWDYLRKLIWMIASRSNTHFKEMEEILIGLMICNEE